METDVSFGLVFLFPLRAKEKNPGVANGVTKLSDAVLYYCYKVTSFKLATSTLVSRYTCILEQKPQHSL